MSAHGLLFAATIGVLGACAALLLAVIVVRLARITGERREERLLAPLRPTLIQVAAGEDDEGLAVRDLAGTTGPTAMALDRRIIRLLTKVRGAPAEQLVEVLRTHGAVHRAGRELTHRAPVRRAQAAQVLGLTGCADAREALEAALQDRFVEVRDAAAYALGLIGDPRSAGPILAAVGGVTDRRGAPLGLPAGAAAEALHGMGIAISPELRTALDDPHPRTRTVAAFLIGGGSFTSGLPRLRELLQSDPDVTVRSMAASAIGRLGRPEDVPALAAHTAETEPASLRRACVAALAELGQRTALPVLAGLVSDPDPRVGEQAATALIGLGRDGIAALEPLQHVPATRSATLVAELRGSSR
ncbi:MAG: HEAT repeat domain-containing protein [Intrasporangium sp.]|uniref:HEAT repeat domain-containing protein n=1 Tax=Intrasporangium sp. TaxID=1925024 RepID=UPI003F7FC9C4